MKTYLGVNALNHDASVSIVNADGIHFWKRSGDSYLNQQLVDEAMSYNPTEVCWYERPLIKKTRQAHAGQWSEVFDRQMLPSVHLKKFGVNLPINYKWHHESHAAAGFYTSPFESAAVVVVDAMGEWTTASIWHAKDSELKCVWKLNYPYSLGLFYSAFTQLIGLTPTKDEYALQQLSEQGDSLRYHWQVKKYLKQNLHQGVFDWPCGTSSPADIAAAVQRVFEEQMTGIMFRARSLTRERQLVYMGGCAMNSLYNQQLKHYWNDVWTLPVPGDAASSFGAVLAEIKCKVRFNQ